MMLLDAASKLHFKKYLDMSDCIKEQNEFEPAVRARSQEIEGNRKLRIVGNVGSFDMD